MENIMHNTIKPPNVSGGTLCCQTEEVDLLSVSISFSPFLTSFVLGLLVPHKMSSIPSKQGDKARSRIAASPEVLAMYKIRIVHVRISCLNR